MTPFRFLVALGLLLASAAHATGQTPSLDELAGQYSRHLGSRQTVTMISDGDSLRARDSGGGGGLLSHDGDLRFRFPGGQLLTFERDDSGRITGFVLSRGSQSRIFHRQDRLEAEYREHAGEQRPHALSDAVLARDLDNATKLIEGGADLSELDDRPEVGGRNGRRPLNWAAILDDTMAIQLLLDAGAEIDATNRSGMTPLHHAAEAGSSAAARLLIERGTDVERATVRGQTALQIAMRRGHADVAELIRTAGASNDCAEPPCVATDSLYEVPVDRDDGLSVGSLVSVGAARDLIDQLLADLDGGLYDQVDGLLIMKDGQLVVERYFGSWDVTKAHQMQSVSKSFTSLLAGSAILQGHVASVSDPISKYLPEHRQLLTGGREAITVEHLLTMSAGLDWNEMSTPPTDPGNARVQEVMSDDSIEFTLARDLVETPGAVFNYSGGMVTVLGEVVRNATGSESLLAYVENSTLARLGFEDLGWLGQKDGRQNAAGGLRLRPRDLAKIGQLMLDDGVWRGERLLPEGWVEASLAAHIETPSDWPEYGYLWWGRTYDTDERSYAVDAARGWGGQELILVRELDLAVILTATNFQVPTALDLMMTRFILPTFESTRSPSVSPARPR